MISLTGMLVGMPGARAADAAQTQTVPVAAQTVAPIVSSLDPVRIQGQSLQTALPSGATVTTRQELDDRAINSWEDFSRRGEPAVGFNRQNDSVNVRGVDQDRVVTRVDGIRLPWINDGARGVKGGLGAVDFNSLSSLDVLRGPDAARSGSVVGALELRSLWPDDLLGPDKNFGALLKSGYDGADDSLGADAALAGRFGVGTTWLLQAGQRRGHELKNKGDVGGYGALRSMPNPEDYTQRNARFVLQHEWSGEHTLSVSGDTFRRRSDIDNRSQQGPGQHFLPGQDTLNKELARDRIMLGYDYRSSRARSALDMASVKLYWQRVRLASSDTGMYVADARSRIIPGDPFRYGFPAGPYGRDNSVQESALGLTAETGGYLNGWMAQHWSAGGEWVGNRTEQYSAGYDNCAALSPGLPAPFGPRTCSFLHSNQADMPRVRGDQWALWAQDEFSWAGGRYALTPALRFDAYSQNPQVGGAYASNPNSAIETQPSNSGQRFSPSLLARYKPQDKLSFYAKYGYGYKAPSATQLYMNYGAPGTYLSVGNPNLKAEISQGWELGVDAGDSKLGGRLSFFDNRYRDFIDERVPFSSSSPEWQAAWVGMYPLGVTGFANRSRVRIYGAELSGHWQFAEHWYTRGSLAWTHGQDMDTHQYLNSVAPLKAVVALGYRNGQWGAEGSVTAARARSNVQYPDATPQAPHPDYQTPGYGVLDLTAYWKPEAVKGMRLQAGIYNVFDRKYWNALNVPTAGGAAIALPIDSYTQPGRSVRVSITYQY